MKKVVFVISGGELDDPAFLQRQAAAIAPAALICADRGARHLEAAGLLPDLIVGDMDSLDERTEARYRAAGCRIVRHSRRKDETDTELALHEAFAMAPAEVWIWGALGHRIDHALANVALLVQGTERGVEVRLIDGWCELFLIAGQKVVQGEAGQTVSLFAWGGKAAGVTLTGFEFPLTKGVIEIGHPRGISNRLTAAEGTIDVDSGTLLAVRFFRPGIFPGEEEE